MRGIKTLIILCSLCIPAFVFAGFRISELTWVNDVGARTEPSGTRVFNVSSFGAVADGNTLDIIFIKIIYVSNRATLSL